MSKLTRVTAKVFGATADGTLADPEIGQFGSAKAGTYVGTGDVATIQNLPAWSNGWIDAVTPTQQFPTLPERTGVDKVLSYQNAYVLQQGIPEWDSATDYYTNGFCSKNGKIYFSKTDNNVNHDPETDTVNWEEFTSGGGSRNIGEIVQSTIPLTDAGLHLLDGALLAYGSYQAFIDYIANLTTGYPDLFCTESQWQTSVTNYGVCGKFVYDSINNTVRLPKYNSKIYTGGGTAPVVGNGKALGMTNGTNNAGAGGKSAYGIIAYTELYGHNNDITDPTGTQLVGTIGITTDPTNSGVIADLSNITTSVDGYYYIVIATSTKTDIEVDIDEIATDLNGKVDKSSLSEVYPVVETYMSGTSWYRVYSDGWCEQGGYITSSDNETKTITFMKSFNNTNYGVSLTQKWNSVNYNANANVQTTSTVSMTITGQNSGVYWRACGYIS